MGGYAWVTLATNDSYSLGALVLAHSLKQVGTKQQLAVLITPGVTGPMRSKLSEVFNVVQEVNILDSKDEANLRLLKRPELGVTFTKLHCWRLTQFEKCVFLDADTLVLENCDELFDREELSAAPDIGWPDCFNSGVFVYRPSNETYEKLIQFALEKGSFDGGDQGLLNLYFSDWAYKDISKHLPFIYNMASNACYSYLPAFKQFGGNAKIIHFIGTSKPWLQYFDTETKQVHPSQGYDHLKIILQHWWNIFCSLIHPQLTPDMAGIAGAFAKLTLGQPRTPEQLALDDHLRRQGWEVGNIDYLGRDSFDNIWSKICETLSTGPASDPPKAKDPSPPRSEAPTVEQPVLEEVKTDIIPTSEPVTETHPPQASTNEAKPGDAVQPIEEPLKPAEDAPKIEPQSEPSKPTEEIPKPAPEPPKSAVEPLTPEVQSPSPAAEPPKSITEVPKSVPEPLQSVEDIPKLATEPPKPAVESPKSASEPPKPAPEPPQPVTEPLKPTEEPTKSVESPPSAVVPTSPVTEALKTVTESPKSVTEIPEPVQESPKPATESIKPAVEPPKPVQEPSKPKPESPIAVTEPAKLESKQADPPKAVAEPSKPEKKSKTDEPSKETPETPTAEKSASEISSPLVCPIKPKQPAAAEEAKEKEEKKAKKVKDTPKAEVTEATPPSSPLSPQLKQTKESLNVETTVPDTPPPASQESSSTGPTPPPRKGSSGTKKTATKAKK